MYLIELILGWLIGKRNGGEYFFMDEWKHPMTLREIMESEERER